MRKRFDVVIVMPVGPDTDPAFVTDTIRSYQHYSIADYKFILIDDSHQGIGRNIKQNNPAIDVLETKKNRGAMAGLYITLADAYTYALEQYDFIAILKLDTDALIIGPRPEGEALALFLQNPRMGIAGQYPFDYEGKPWDAGWPRARMINATMTWKFIKRPIANVFLRKYYLMALRNGYKPGESVFGGAYFISKNLLTVLQQQGLLPNPILGKLNLGEDHLFSLLARAVGFELGDLSAPGRPFACAWKGLPAPPEQLFNEGRKIVHSTRSWKDMNEEDIRNYFRQTRTSKEEHIALVRSEI